MPGLTDMCHMCNVQGNCNTEVSVTPGWQPCSFRRLHENQKGMFPSGVHAYIPLHTLPLLFSWFKSVKVSSVNVSILSGNLLGWFRQKSNHDSKMSKRQVSTCLLSGNLFGWLIQQSNHDLKVSKRQVSMCLFSLGTSLGDWYNKAIMI